MQIEAVEFGAGADNERAELLVIADMRAAERSIGCEAIQRKAELREAEVVVLDAPAVAATAQSAADANNKLRIRDIADPQPVNFSLLQGVVAQGVV